VKPFVPVQLLQLYGVLDMCPYAIEKTASRAFSFNLHEMFYSDIVDYYEAQGSQETGEIWITITVCIFQGIRTITNRRTTSVKRSCKCFFSMYAKAARRVLVYALPGS